MKKSKLIVILLIVVIIIILIFSIKKRTEKNDELVGINIVTENNVEALIDGTKLNNSESLKENKKLGDLEIKNIQLSRKSGKTQLVAEVENKGKTDIDTKIIEIVMLDENGKELGRIPGVISNLKAGKTTKITSITQNDYSNAYNFIINEK